MNADCFSKLVFNISQQLSAQNVEAIKYMYKIIGENITSLKVLMTLESKGVFSSSNIQGLKVLLTNIERCDLLDMVESMDDKRLELCYFQAMDIERKLEVIKADLLDFCSKQECSPTDWLFCNNICSRVQNVRNEMEYLVRPLTEYCSERQTNGSNKRSVGKVESPNASKFKDHQRFMCYSNPRRTQHIQQTNQGEKIPTHSSSHCAHQRHRMCQKRLHNNDFFPVKMDKSTVGVQFYHLTKSSSTPDHHQQANLVKFNPTNVRTDKIHLAQSIPTLKRRVNDQSVSVGNLMETPRRSNIPILKKRLQTLSSQRTADKDPAVIATNTF